MQAPAVLLLLDKCASCNVVDPMGVSPLFVCASAGCAPITDMLLLAKADPNVKIANGQVCGQGRACVKGVRLGDLHVLKKLGSFGRDGAACCPCLFGV